MRTEMFRMSAFVPCPEPDEPSPRRDKIKMKCNVSHVQLGGDELSVNTAMGYELGDRKIELEYHKGRKIYILSKRPDRCKTHSLLSMGGSDYSFGVKRPGHEVHHSLPCNAKSENSQSCTCTPPHILMASCLID
jgi:hypothetical protein